MKDEDKLIEETAKIIENAFKVYFGPNDLVEPEDFPYQAKDLAKELLKYYQPKIHKDSVVLSRELLEVNDVKSVDELVIISRPNLMAKLDLKEKEASKETAERDFNTIIKALKERKDSVKSVYGLAVGIDMAISEVERIAKQFDVDIKEE